MQRRVWGVVGNLTTVLLQISPRLRRWKNFENRPVFDEVMHKILLVRFFPDTVYMYSGSVAKFFYWGCPPFRYGVAIPLSAAKRPLSNTVRSLWERCKLHLLCSWLSSDRDRIVGAFRAQKRRLVVTSLLFCWTECVIEVLWAENATKMLQAHGITPLTDM